MLHTIMKPTRYEAVIDFAPPKFKAPGKVPVAIGTVGVSEAVPAVIDADGKELKAATAPQIVWSGEVGQLVVRNTTNPSAVRDEMIASLEHVIAELKKFDLPAKI